MPGPSSTDVVIVRDGGAGLGGADPDLGGSPEAVVDVARGGVAGAAVVLGLKYRWIVAPSAISYSLRSFESVKALPLSNSRWESGAGADDEDCAIRALS